jgi:hypothetical protein
MTMTDFTLTTYPSGTRWNLADPQPHNVNIRDIAWALANGAVRFAGHIRGAYSVAQHSVLVHDLLAGNRGWPNESGWRELSHSEQCGFDEARLQFSDGTRDLARDAGLHALFHDAHEAYLGDLISPLKKLLRAWSDAPGLASPWDQLEAQHDAAIFDALKLGRYWAGECTDRSQEGLLGHALHRVRRFDAVVHLADMEAYRIENEVLRSPLASLDALPGRAILTPVEAANLFLTRARPYLGGCCEPPELFSPEGAP